MHASMSGRPSRQVSWAKLIDRYWSQHEKPRGRASPPYRATQRRNSRSGRKPNNWEKTVRPWFTHYCRPGPDLAVLRLAGFQIAATKTPTQLSAIMGLAGRDVIVSRTVVILNLRCCYPRIPTRHRCADQKNCASRMDRRLETLHTA